MSQNVGTLITSPIRPNSNLDNIPVAFDNELKGGHHSYKNLIDRDNIISSRRTWGMLCTVYDDAIVTNNKTYKLVFNNVDTDIMNNNNWVELKNTLDLSGIINTPVSYDGLTGSQYITASTFSISLPNIVTASTVGGNNLVPIFNIDSKGRITSTSSYQLPTNYETVTYAGITTMINNNSLVPNKQYEIIDADSSLYGGTSVYVKALTTNTISSDAIGKFYNPKYDSYNIWKSSSPYNIGDIVIWGNDTWVNVSGNVGSSLNDFQLNSDWIVINKNTINYDLSYDRIKFSYSNNIIYHREDIYGNIVSFSDIYYTYLQSLGKPSPIKYFQWGNQLVVSTYVRKGIFNNKIIESYINMINFIGDRIIDTELYDNSYIDTFTSKQDCYIDGISLYNSYINNFTLNNNSYLKGLDMRNSYQQSFNLQSFAFQLNLTFINSAQYNFTLQSTKFQSNLLFNSYNFDRANISIGVNELNVTLDNNLYYNKLTGVNYIVPTLDTDYTQKAYVDKIITDVFTVSSTSSLIGLTTSSKGDLAVVYDISKTFILSNNNYNNINNWIELKNSIELVDVISASTIGNTFSIPVISYDSKGRIISATTNTPTVSINYISGLSGSTSTQLNNTIDITTIYNTTLSDSITTPYVVGGITQGIAAATLKNKSLVEIFDDILFPTVNPTYTQPTATLTATAGLYEVGKTYSIDLNISYTQNDAGTAVYYDYLKSNISVATSSLPLYTDNLYDIIPKTNIYTSAVYYSDGIIKNDNKGNPYPVGQILQGMVSTTPTRTMKTIFPYFWGKVSSTYSIISDTDILSGTKVLSEANTTLTISFNTNSNEKAWFAVPVSVGSQTTINYNNWYVNSLNKGNIGGTTNLFGSASNVIVNFNGSSTTYSVYLMNYSSSVSTMKLRLI